MPEALRVVLTFLAGLVTGVLSGMFGIGGAVVSNPAVRALGAAPIVSVGSTLPSIIPGAISGALRYRREGLIRSRVVLLVGLPGMAASVGGALLSALVPEPRVLTIAIACLVIFTAVRTARRTRPVPPVAEADTEAIVDVAPAPRAEDAWRLILIGLLAGLFSGLLGIGGGLLMVPLFLGWLHLPLKESLGTSLACVGILAVPGTITHTVLGHIDWSYAIPLAIAVIPGARIGAALALRANERGLRIAVATMLSVVGVGYIVTEIVGLVT